MFRGNSEMYFVRIQMAVFNRPMFQRGWSKDLIEAAYPIEIEI